MSDHQTKMTGACFTESSSSPTIRPETDKSIPSDGMLVAPDLPIQEDGRSVQNDHGSVHSSVNMRIPSAKAKSIMKEVRQNTVILRAPTLPIHLRFNPVLADNDKMTKVLDPDDRRRNECD